jgi:hypothetical protein
MIVPEHLDPRLNPKVQRALVWTGPLVVVLLCAGLIPIAGFFPIPSPLRTSEQIAAMYVDHQLSIRIGCAVMMIGGALWASWCGVIAMFMRRMESGYPSLTYTALCCIGYGVWIFEAFPLVWAVAAFRADAVSPEITRMLNDVGWFFFVFTWPPFALLCFCLAAAILHDRNTPVIFPRWVAYLNVFSGLALTPGILIAFFKNGPFAYNGILSVYIPLAIFFIWIVIMTKLLFGAIDAEQRRLAATPAPAADPVQAGPVQG